METEKVGHIATAQILLLYSTFNRDIPSLASCIASLNASRKEVTWQDEVISGWSYLSSGPPVPCIEPTCWVYLAYNALSGTDDDRIKLETHNFLQTTQTKSEEGSSWSFTPWTQSRISPTCMAIRVLSRIGDKHLVSEAARWLLSARDSQGLWGPSHRSRATITHTSLAVIALTEAGYNSKNPILLTAYSFLADWLNKWLSVSRFTHLTESNVFGFGDALEVPVFSNIAPRPTRIRYYYNPFVLSALALSTDLQSYLPYVEAIAIRAIKSWDTERWRHPLLEGDYNMTSWSFYDYMHMLKPLFCSWADDRKSAVFYLCLPKGPFLARISRVVGILRFIRSERASLVFRIILLLIVPIVLMCFLFKKIGPWEVLGAILCGLITNILYGLYKKRWLTYNR